MLIFNSKFLLLLLSLRGLQADAQSIYRIKAPYKPYFTTSTYYNISTQIACAIKCFHLNCPYFTFQDGSCQIHDPGYVATNDSSAMYKSFDPAAPAPESLIDVAFQKTCYCSSQYPTHGPNRAVDGDVTTQFHSGDRANNWWGVDLGNTYVIRVIDVLPHRGVANWFQNVKLYVGPTLVANADFSSYTEVAHYPGIWNGVGRLQFTPSSVAIGRFVFIQGLSGTKLLNLLDVKVMV